MEEKTSPPRERVIVRTSAAGIAVNLLLAAFKATVGLAAHSVAVVLDAVNNVGDALSSVITIAGTRLAGRRPDKKHPFGYGRIEYMAAISVAVVILYAGITSLVESVKRILKPDVPQYSALSLVVIAVAVAVKVALGLFVRRTGKAVRSDPLVASGTDALFDSIISAATLAAAAVYLLWGVGIEAWLGAVIALFIIKSGAEMLFETVSRILGERTEGSLAREVKETVCAADPEVRGAYDLVLNNYGPDRLLGSVHVEVPDGWSAARIDALSRRIQQAVYERHRVIISAVGVYAANAQDAAVREQVEAVLAGHPFVMQMHGLYAEPEEKRLRFDIIINFDCPDAAAEYRAVVAEVQERFPGWHVAVTSDTDASD